jgi:hypothetical protein
MLSVIASYTFLICGYLQVFVRVFQWFAGRRESRAGLYISGMIFQDLHSCFFYYRVKNRKSICSASNNNLLRDGRDDW